MGSVPIKVDAGFIHSDIYNPPDSKDIKVKFFDGSVERTLNLKELLQCPRCLHGVELQDRNRWQDIVVVFYDGKSEKKLPLVEFVEDMQFSSAVGKIRLQNSGYQAVSHDDYIVVKEANKDGSWVDSYIPVSDFVENPQSRPYGPNKYSFPKELNTREKRLRFLREKTGLALHGKWGTLLEARDEWRSKKQNGFFKSTHRFDGRPLDNPRTAAVNLYIAKVALAMLGKKGVRFDPNDEVSISLRSNGDIDFIISQGNSFRSYQFQVDGYFSYFEWDANERKQTEYDEYIDQSLIVKTQDWLLRGGKPNLANS